MQRAIMEVILSSIFGLILMALTAESIEVHTMDPDAETENAFPTISTTETAFAGVDNGMTLGEIPKQLNADEVIHSFEVSEVVHESNNETSPVRETLLSVEFPENHKNFTASPYAGAIEVPPLLNQFNVYQHQYKTYYKQKSMNDRKPIKFEENSTKNRYVPEGLGSYLEDDDSRYKHGEQHRDKDPFPYVYENERIPLMSHHFWTDQNRVRDSVGNSLHYFPSPNQANAYGVNYAGYSDSKDERKELSGWKKALKFFTALVPLGLFLATLTPSIISVNSTDGQKSKRQRYLDDSAKATTDDLKERSNELTNSADDAQCENRLICEMARLGKDESGTRMQNSLWYMAVETSDDVAQQLGVKGLFRAIRAGNCELYACERISSNVARHRGNKKKASTEIHDEKKI